MANESPSATPTPQAEPHSAETKARVQSLVAQGVPYRDITTQTGVPTGTIRYWNHKHRWSATRDTAIATQKAQLQAETAAQWLERASSWRSRMALIAERQLKHVEGIDKPLPPKALGDWLDSLDKLDKLGRRQFGLDAQASSPQVQVITSGNVLLRRDDREREASEQAGDAVDV